MNTIDILSLGWGVQSFTLAAMAALGQQPRVEMAIHADTGHEYTVTYQFAEKWTPWLQGHGVRVITVSAENTDIVKNDNETPIPAFTIAPTGKQGQLRRQCTDRWKIRPMRKYIRQITDHRRDVHVNQWLGISLDEIVRAKDSDVKWITNKFPLLDLKMTRMDCVNWLTNNGLDVPPPSSRIFCPYHDNQSWTDLKTQHKLDYASAVAADRKIRDTRPPYPLFVHPSRKPLDQMLVAGDFGAEQLRLWDNECSGVCGV